MIFCPYFFVCAVCETRLLEISFEIVFLASERTIHCKGDERHMIFNGELFWKVGKLENVECFADRRTRYQYFYNGGKRWMEHDPSRASCN